VKRLSPLLPLALAAATLFAACSAAPDLPGKAEFEWHCGICHPLANVLARRNDRDGWIRVVTAMRARGANLTDEQALLVIDYLTAVRPAK